MARSGGGIGSWYGVQALYIPEGALVGAGPRRRRTSAQQAFRRLLEPCVSCCHIMAGWYKGTAHPEEWGQQGSVTKCTCRCFEGGAPAAMHSQSAQPVRQLPQLLPQALVQAPPAAVAGCGGAHLWCPPPAQTTRCADPELPPPQVSWQLPPRSEIPTWPPVAGRAKQQQQPQSQQQQSGSAVCPVNHAAELSICQLAAAPCCRQ